MDDRQDRPSTDPAPLARRTPVARKDAIETEDREVVDRVASLLGRWADDDGGS